MCAAAICFRLVRVIPHFSRAFYCGGIPEHLAEQEVERFTVCNYSTYNPERSARRNGERNAQRNTIKEGLKELEKDTHKPADAGARVSPEILLEIYRQQNQSLPEVKALTSERLRKCRSRIDQAVHDGCLEQYLADFTSAVKKAQQTPFLNGKTHLLCAQYRELVTAGMVYCHVRTTRELVEELRRAEFDEDFTSPVIAAASRREPYHLFWDDIDKLKLTDFKTEVLFDLVE